MIVKRHAFKNDVIKLSEHDIEQLRQGKTLTVEGLDIVHVCEKGEWCNFRKSCDANTLPAALAKGVSKNEL